MHDDMLSTCGTFSIFIVSLSCIVLYRTCLEMVADGSSPLQSTQEKDFEGGVHLGIGGFNLVRERLPC